MASWAASHPGSSTSVAGRPASISAVSTAASMVGSVPGRRSRPTASQGSTSSRRPVEGSTHRDLGDAPGQEADGVQ